MDLPSPTLSAKLSRTESVLCRDDPSHIHGDLNDPKDPMVQRCVIIQKDEKGYGLTVSGDNPVFVQSVKEDGAAARAGVQQGDRIIKVNGTLVTQSNHQEVVELIKSGSYVALTLLGKPPGQNRSSLSPQHSFNLSGTSAGTMNSNKSDTSERITGPQPVDPEKQQHLTNSKIHTYKKMLEQEMVYLENLKMEFSKTASEKMRAEMNATKKRVKTLEEQLCSLTGLQHEQIITRSPKSPTSARHMHDRESYRSISFPAHGMHNRPLIHQISAPALPANQVTTPPTVISFVPSSSDPKYQVILSPCNEVKDVNQKSPDKKQSISTSLENLTKHLNPRSTTWPQPTHTRQSSSPETLRGLENIKCQKSNGCTKLDSLHRSPSAVSPPHAYFKNLLPNLETKLNNPNASRVSSFSQHDSAIESPGPSPPSTPPEPVESNKSARNSFEGEELTQHDEHSTPETSVEDFNIPLISKLNQNTNIICMEDDDFSSDTEMGHLEDHGPFNGLWKLVRNPAHLSVFLHYLMSNSDPSSLFFYLISEMYEQGTAKEMKKWAYEIHSSFLVPGAPLKVSLVDETILHEIDDVLLNNIDKEEVLRTIFRKARKKAKEELNDFLADFRNKRTMGLANIFGPPDYQLEEAMHDKIKEQKIIEQLLAPCLENFSEDLEGVDDRTAAKTYALATILKQLGGIKNPQCMAVIGKCPTFVEKDKLFTFSSFQRNKKVMVMQAHHFIPEHYCCVTYCNHCQLIIWGIGHQGYQCQNCEMNIHKSCIKVVEEYCIGERKKKEKTKERTRKDRKSGIVENLIAKTRKPSQPVPAAIERAKKLNEEMNADNGIIHDPHAKEGGRGLEHLKEPSDIVFQNMLNLSETGDKPHSSNKKNSTSIGRSESFRQTRESKPSFRKRSDPNIPRSKSDVDVDDKHNSGLNESRSSSNSSLSNRSLDSPSNSSEMVHRTPTSVSADSVPPNFAPTTGMLSASHNLSSSTDDSDLEADTDPPNWQENVNWDVLKIMKPKEKKRQDVINELFHTERTHVRNLKVLDRLFYKPMLQEQLLPPDFLNLLFPNLEEMLEIHTTFNNKMKARRKTEPVIGDIGQLMLERFDGAAGDHLKQAAATYCQNQSIALENLKFRQKKDTKLAQSLADAEANNLCRRLQLKDIIASGFQRLTKYPLLLENIAKYTPPNTQELNELQRAVDCSKEILVHVDSAIKEAENRHRLLDIQKKMDKSSFEKDLVEKEKKERSELVEKEKKEKSQIVENFKNLDVTKHKLVYEGTLVWRLSKQKTVEMHVVLLEDILILFQKQDEKYILKFHNTILTSGREDTKIMHSPILRVQNLFTRDNATDKRTFFIISSSEMHAMYEFVAATALEKKTWCQHVDRAVLEQKKRNMMKNSVEIPHPVPEALSPSDEHQEDVESGTTEVVSANEMTKDSQPTEDHSDNVPVSKPEPDEPKPSEPPDETPQRARRISAEDNPDEPTRAYHRLDRIERIEILEIMEGPQLIEPSEVIVTSGAVFQTAEPVLTPLEKLRRKDMEISKAMEEKDKITSEILQVPLEDLQKFTEVNDDIQDLSTVDLITVALQQGNKLSSLINESLNLEETSLVLESSGAIEMNESVIKSNTSKEKQHSPGSCLTLKTVETQALLPISTVLNQCLTQLLVAINSAEDERKLLRKELSNCQEKLHQAIESHRHCVTQSPSVHSRPCSFISVSSTTSDGTGEYYEVPHLLSVLEKSEESLNVEAISPKPSNVSSSPIFSSPIHESALKPERWKSPEESEISDRTCDQLSNISNCDVQNSSVDEVPCTSEDKVPCTSEDKVPSTEEDRVPCSSEEQVICSTEDDAVEAHSDEVLDSLCRTFEEQHKVDPVYL